MGGAEESTAYPGGTVVVVDELARRDIIAVKCSPGDVLAGKELSCGHTAVTWIWRLFFTPGAMRRLPNKERVPSDGNMLG
jgi:hypothetical protein